MTLFARAGEGRFFGRRWRNILVGRGFGDGREDLREEEKEQEGEKNNAESAEVRGDCAETELLGTEGDDAEEAAAGGGFFAGAEEVVDVAGGAEVGLTKMFWGAEAGLRGVGGGWLFLG